MRHSFPSTAIGLDDSYREENLRRQHSSSSLQSTIDSCGFSGSTVMNASRVNPMRRSINEHVNAVSKLLLTSKKSSDKKFQIESALRFLFLLCKKAFFKRSTIYLCLLKEKKSDFLLPFSIKNMISQAFMQFGAEVQIGSSAVDVSNLPRSYAAVAETAALTIKVARSLSIAIKKSTKFLVIPEKDIQDKFTTAKDTMKTFQRIIKPADYNLKVNMIKTTRNREVVH